MVEKYFMHRIQEENGVFSKGIEVHDTLDSAIVSFWGRMKLGYNNPDKPGISFVSCKIKNSAGGVVGNYDLTWQRDREGEFVNTFFMHHVKVEGDAIDKQIDVCADFDAARLAYAKVMELGYGNPMHPDVEYVSCEITDRTGSVLLPFNETWEKQEAIPEA